MLFGKHINKYYKKYFWFFFFGIAALIFVDVIQVYVPQITGEMIDNIQEGKITFDNLTLLWQEVAWIFIIGVGMFTGRLVWRVCILGESIRVQADLRYEMFKKAEVLTQRYYKENKTGAILSYFSNDLETIEESFGFGIVQLVDGIFMLIISFTKMVQVNLILSLITLIPLALLGCVAFFVDRLMEKYYHRRQKAFEDLSDFAQENFTGIRVIKAFVKEKKELRQFSKEALKNKDANIKFARLSAFLDVAFDLLIYIIFGVVMIGGVYYVSKGTMSVGQVVMFVGFVDTIIWPIFALSMIINLVARGRTSLSRISKMLDEQVEIVDDNIVLPEDIKGSIEFKNFSFSYPDAKDREKALSDISFRIEPGENVGIVGKIGSGKSTLVNMLFRLYNVKEGTLFVGDYDIMHLPYKYVRDLIGYCPQDNFLYSDTIKANLGFSGNYNDVQIKEAADFSAIRSNIEDFPEGYETMIGEKGVSLSGGQKQRLSISRAYIKQPEILILDDSVSAVDVKTEETILHNIREKRKGKTTILIASRVSTVKSLDKILVMNNGRVDAFGTHEECMAKSAIYAKMVELQQLEKEMEGK